MLLGKYFFVHTCNLHLHFTHLEQMTRSSKANVKRDPDAKNKRVKKEGEDVNGIEPTKLESSSLGQNQARRHVFFKEKS